MKKIYNSPKVLVSLINTQKMVCTSVPNAGIDPSKSVTANDVESRRGSSWDDEEE